MLYTQDKNRQPKSRKRKTKPHGLQTNGSRQRTVSPVLVVDLGRGVLDDLRHRRQALQLATGTVDDVRGRTWI